MPSTWGNRFNKSMDELIDRFLSSIESNKHYYYWDIKGSIAHARMLGDCGIISKEDVQLIIAGLLQLLGDLESGRCTLDPTFNDIYMQIEVLLTERIGDAGKKLHTGRSRNDQAALDMRLYTRAEILIIQNILKELLQTILSIAEQHVNTIMPGYTHQQLAQPVSFAHHLLAFFAMFKRDWNRLNDSIKRTAICPLGAGALATSSYPLNPQQVAKELQMFEISFNSMDAVGDRDFAIEIISHIAMIMMHLSRCCTEIIFWSSHEAQFIELKASFSAKTSIMPQKRNPDMAEVIRGKTGRVYGDLMAILTIMKGLPLSYNRDIQEDIESLFDAVDTSKKSLIVFTHMLKTLKVNKESMRQAAAEGFTNATDAADYLVKKGLPFRDAHKIVEKVVSYCLKNKKTLETLTLNEYQCFSSMFSQDIFDAIDIKACVHNRNLPGGPSPQRVKEAIAKGQHFLYQI